MIQVRKAEERGHFDHGWLDTFHTFSFADYYDPAHLGFRALRVINEDRVAPGRGFGMHGHRDMEIITYVLEGELEHKDSLGTGSIIRAGELQHMTAGTGVRHSEFNPSASQPVHLYQIWLLPDRAGLRPSYEQRAFAADERRGKLRLVASPNGEDGSLPIRQDARVYLSTLKDEETAAHVISAGRHVWVQVLRGNVAVNGQSLHAGDGAAGSGEESVTIKSDGDSEIMLFDLA
jgi:redox-sensitive bicupin YhaK (pirin superfamily)